MLCFVMWKYFYIENLSRSSYGIEYLLFQQHEGGEPSDEFTSDDDGDSRRC